VQHSWKREKGVAIVMGMSAQLHIATRGSASRIAESSRIAIKTKGRILFIDPELVVVVLAQGNYVLLKREMGSYLLRESMSAIAEKLKPYGFVRINRSVLVNRSKVDEIRPWTTGEYVLRLKDGKEYTVTRAYKKNLKELATSWIGTDAFSTE
jgi:DNA-binding LytR/AlgR family response regulator